MADYRGDVTELKIEDTKVGTGQEVKVGDTIEVHYTGKLLDGKVFDSSIPRGQTASFGIGIGQVIEGWDKGLIGMKVGGTRVLTIPPEMGYGARGAGASIPPDASLIFEVQLVSIK
jgi:FKBP-type peptidyl-prolyl cis-trans isomerase